MENYKPQLIALCKRYHVIDIALFGSMAKNLSNEESDIDLLVGFSEDIPLLAYAENYLEFKERLEQLFNKKVDLLTVKSLKNPVLIDEINSTKIPLYAA